MSLVDEDEDNNFGKLEMSLTGMSSMSLLNLMMNKIFIISNSLFI